MFLVSPLGCPRSSALHKSPRSCCPSFNRKPSFPPDYLQLPLHTVFQPAEAWCAGAPTGQQAARPVLVLCSPAGLGKGWGARGAMQGFLVLLEEPQISAKLQGIFSHWAPFQSWHIFLYLTGMGDGQREGRN